MSRSRSSPADDARASPPLRAARRLKVVFGGDADGGDSLERPPNSVPVTPPDDPRPSGAADTVTDEVALEAAPHLEAALAGAAPVETPSLARQAYDHFQAGENTQAAAALETMLAQAPADKMLRAKLITAYLRAVVQIEPVDVAEAERLLRRALEVDGENANARLSYSKFLLRQGRGAENEAVDAAAPQADPVPPRTPSPMQFLWAKKAYDARDYDTAVDRLEHLLATDPNHAQANALLVPACYRAGRLDHPVVERARREQAKPISFVDALARLAHKLGVDPAVGDGLPDRSDWTPVQRFEWGRFVDSFLRTQVFAGPETLAKALSHARPFVMPPELLDGSAVIFLLHVGSVNLAIAQMAASGIPYTLVTNSVPYGIANPDRVLDVYSGRATTLLARMAMVLRRGACVAVAVDGPLGRRLDLFEHLGVEYPIAAGPLVLAHQMRARTYLLVGGFEADAMACHMIEGPPAATPLDALETFWRGAIHTEVERVTALGPENFIRMAKPPERG